MDKAYHSDNKALLPMDKVYDRIVTSLIHYVEDNPAIKNFVIGVSGGIDSTVVSALAYEACRRMNLRKSKNDTPIQVIGLSLPSSTNSGKETLNADLTMQAFCHQYDTLHIDGMFTIVNDAFDTYTGKLDKLSNVSKIGEGNIKTRLRAMVLYQAAAAYNGIVLDTDNLSEYYLGFFTRSGDQFDFSPMAGLWKDEVYELACYIRDHTGMSEIQKQALDAAVSITPTDGNSCFGKGRDTDQIAYGYTYTEIDCVLNELLETTPDAVGMELHPRRRIEMVWETLNDLPAEASPLDIDDEADLDYSYEMVEGVCKRHFNSQFKRDGHPIRVPRKIYADPDSDEPRDVYAVNV